MLWCVNIDVYNYTNLVGTAVEPLINYLLREINKVTALHPIKGYLVLSDSDPVYSCDTNASSTCNDSHGNVPYNGTRGHYNTGRLRYLQSWRITLLELPFSSTLGET